MMWVLLLVTSLQVAGQTPASCETETQNGGLASGDIEDRCGDHSECINNRQCSCVSGYFTPSGNHTDCQNSNEADPLCSDYDSECIFCGSKYEGPCEKCVNVIYRGQCLNQCPDNTGLEIQNFKNFSLTIRTCKGSATSALPEWALIVITVMGSVILVIIAVIITSIACAFLRRSSVGQLDIAERTARSDEQAAKSAESSTMENLGTEEYDGNTVMDDYFESDDASIKISDEEKEEFFTKLSVLRLHSEMFLKMLNDMRRRLKELPQTSPATQQYKNVMRDLTRLLYMLNKKPENVRIPPDGLQLLTWSEQILNRYLVAQGKPPINNSTTSSSNVGVSPQRLSVIGDQVETQF